MIYTSYFGAIHSFSKNMIPIAICGKPPDNWKGLCYKKLAPKFKFFMEWRKNHDNNFYVEHFNDEVLSKLNPNEIVRELYEMIGDSSKDIVLVCYEKPKNFCHRHLVRKWLVEHEYPCTELSIIKEE